LITVPRRPTISTARSAVACTINLSTITNDDRK
jgi:hypothetical protein